MVTISLIFCVFWFFVAFLWAYKNSTGLIDPVMLFLLYLFLQILGSWIVLQMFSYLFVNHHVPQVKEAYVAQAFLLTSIGLIFFVLGGIFKAQFRSAKVRFVARLPVSYFTLALIVIFCYWIFFYFISQYGGLAEFADTRQTFRSEGIRGQGVLLFIPTTLLALTLLYYVKQRISFGQNQRSYFWLLIICLIMIVPALIIGFRGLVLIPLLQLIFLYHCAYKIEFKWRYAVVLVLLGFSFTTYGVYRQWSEVVVLNADLIEGVLKIAADRPELFADIFLRVRGVDTIAAIMNYYDFSTYLFFFPSLVEALTIPIPSGLWDKPVPIIVDMGRSVFGSEVGGISPTAIGELYMHAGVFGVSLGMFLLGFIGRLITEKIRFCQSRQRADVLFSLFCTFFILFSETLQGYLNLLVLSILSFAFILVFLHGSQILSSLSTHAKRSL